MADCKRAEDDQHSASSADNDEVVSVDKKYGGLVPKKKPLISKDHERAFFDSADWVLYKKTPHQQLPPRKPTCISGTDSTSS